MLNFSFWIISIDSKGYLTKQVKSSSRFANDKIHHEDDIFVILSDGIILNKKEIVNSDSMLKDYYQGIYSDISRIKKMVGPFNGLIYNKKEKKGIAFGNQTGDSSIFYGYDETRTIYISNNYNEVVKRCNLRRVNTKAAHFLLTYGFYADDTTIVEGVNRLKAGEYLEFTPEKCETKIYHRFNFHDKISISMDDAIEQLDVLFRKAVKRCFEKDLEYGYKYHLADLSAGLDSRMTNVVARELGFHDIINISYSQSGSSEYKYTNQLAQILGNTLYYRPLDDASFIYDIDDTVKEEFGMAYYCGITGGRQFLQLIDFSKLGLEHTGQLGDIIISSFFERNEREIDVNTKRNSTLLPLRYYPEISDYKSHEEFTFYTRGFQGALSTHYIRSNYTYAVSPFIDVPFLEFCASLPDEIRAHHKLYWNWIDCKYPLFGKVPSSRLRMYEGISFKDSLLMYKERLIGRLRRDTYRIANKIGLYKTGTSPDNMNPHTYWYETKPELRSFISGYFNEKIHLLDEYPEIKEDAIRMIGSDSALDKLMAISMLATVNQYCKK